MRRHVLPALGDRRLSEIGPRDIARFANDLRMKGLSRNSVRLALAPLKALLATAFEKEVIRRNPAENVRTARPTASDEAPRAKALTEEELRALLAEIPEPWTLFFAFLAQTGLRIGEALALRWADVDFGARRSRVARVGRSPNGVPPTNPAMPGWRRRPWRGESRDVARGKPSGIPCREV